MPFGRSDRWDQAAATLAAFLFDIKGTDHSSYLNCERLGGELRPLHAGLASEPTGHR